MKNYVFGFFSLKCGVLKEFFPRQPSRYWKIGMYYSLSLFWSYRGWVKYRQCQTQWTFRIGFVDDVFDGIFLERELLTTFRVGFYWIVLGLEKNPIRNVAKQTGSRKGSPEMFSLTATGGHLDRYFSVGSVCGPTLPHWRSLRLAGERCLRGGVVNKNTQSHLTVNILLVGVTSCFLKMDF